jgi:hypothetical protein
LGPRTARGEADGIEWKLLGIKLGHYPPERGLTTTRAAPRRVRRPV